MKTPPAALAVVQRLVSAGADTGTHAAKLTAAVLLQRCALVYPRPCPPAAVLCGGGLLELLLFFIGIPVFDLTRRCRYAPGTPPRAC